MRNGFDQHIDDIITQHGALAQEPRLVGGARLVAQFEHAVTAYRRHGAAQVNGVVERVNELIVARHLLDDPTLADTVIDYEPEVIAGGSRFDFRSRDSYDKSARVPLYVEVKTIAPRTAETPQNWWKAQQRLQHVTPGNHVIVAEDWLGATIAGNAFAARSAFLTYSLETESKLALHSKVASGRAILVFCGTGFHWDISELEDFSDYYLTGRHRLDDPYASMEAHSIAEKNIAFARTIDGFAALLRHADATSPSKLRYPVRGPAIF